MSTLQDLAVAEDDTDREAVEDVFQTEETASSGGSSIRTSADAYRDINRQIGSFYEQPEPEDDQKTLELESSRSRRTTRKRWNWSGAYRNWNAGRKRNARQRKPPTSSSA